MGFRQILLTKVKKKDSSQTYPFLGFFVVVVLPRQSFHLKFTCSFSHTNMYIYTYLHVHELDLKIDFGPARKDLCPRVLLHLFPYSLSKDDVRIMLNCLVEKKFFLISWVLSSSPTHFYFLIFFFFDFGSCRRSFVVVFTVSLY